MASASITTRDGRHGRRFVVRYRLGGRAYPVCHGGSFPTLREARIRRDLIAGEIAAGRNPADLLGTLTTQPVARTFADWAEAYKASRVDVSANTMKNIGSAVASFAEAFGGKAPSAITPADVQQWIAGSALQPASVRRYMDTLRSLLDYAGVDPNPARDGRVRLPRQVRDIIEPPSAAHVEALLFACAPRYRLAVQTLAETGLRVGELHQLEWRDVDEAGSRFRIRGGKTKAARRWVTVPVDLMVEIGRTASPDARTAEPRVFPGATPMAMHKVVVRACQAAGIPRFHPHDLRHRYASVQIARGVPVTNLAAQLGHTRNSMTLDTYSHVLLDEGDTR